MLSQRCTTAIIALVFTLACSSPSPSGSPSAAAPDPNAAAIAIVAKRDPDSLMIIDCMLPGQVRKLGSKLTYLTQPRPVRTTGVDCEIRGGEYVALDRASYADSLRVWLPLAEGGDPKAQTFVGEIFEKGLGVQPDYPSAIQWYTKAANQGYGPAQINLGQLYELGHGVPKDPQIALDWYRKASGLSDLDQEFVSFVGDANQYQELRTELERESAKSQKLRNQVTGLHRELGQSREQRANLQERLKTDESKLAAQRGKLAAEKEKIERERTTLANERTQLAAARSKPAPAPAPAPAPVVTAKAPTPAPPPPPKTDPEAEAKVQALLAKVANREKEVAALEQSLANQQAEAATRQAELDEKGKKLSDMDVEIQRLAQEAEQQREQFQKQVETQVAQVATGPKIMLIDPPLPLTRSSDAAPVISQSKEQTIVGRIDAPAGLMSLLVNDVEEKVDKDGFFQTSVRVRQVGTDVNILAIDQQGKRASRQFVLRRGDRGPIATAARSQAPIRFETASTSIDFGKYYALVIGNANYPNMPTLETARADAKGVAALLQTRYGFQVKTLYDADRYSILMALNDLRGRLGPNDNLLIYYAGHGEFDRPNDQGYWLPIDAEPGNKVNWIANDAITDILNAIKAKHILVVADSCYSGSLTESPIPQLDATADPKTRINWQSRVESKSSRTALTSGGLAPVLDGGGGSNSIFARALIDILKGNDDVLDGYRLYSEVSARVRYKARSASFQQDPQYAPIRFGQHGGGEFFFVPTT